MNEILKSLTNQAFTHRLPFDGQFELTPTCNFTCNMCYLHTCSNAPSPRTRPASFWLSIAEQAKDAGMMVLGLTGGETLLYPQLDELMDGLTKMGFLLSFNTNGSLIDEHRVEWFQSYPVTKINISLYGASDATYQRLCHAQPGTFEKVLRGIDLLLESGQNVYLTALHVAENDSDQDQMEALAAARGLTLHKAGYVFPSLGSQQSRIAPNRAAQDRFHSIMKVSTGLADCARICQLLEADLPRNFPICNGGRSSFAVSAEGRLIPCVMMKHLGVDLSEMPFLEAWESLKVQMEQAVIPEKCQGCKYAGITCQACKGSLYREQQMEGSTEYLCETARQLESMANSMDYRGVKPSDTIVWKGNCE